MRHKYYSNSYFQFKGDSQRFPWTPRFTTKRRYCREELMLCKRNREMKRERERERESESCDNRIFKKVGKCANHNQKQRLHSVYNILRTYIQLFSAYLTVYINFLSASSAYRQAINTFLKLIQDFHSTRQYAWNNIYTQTVSMKETYQTTHTHDDD